MRLISRTAPEADLADRQALVREITVGRFSSLTLPGQDPAGMKSLALASFTSGSQWLFLVGAGVTIAAAAMTLRLVRADETPPVASPVRHASRSWCSRGA